MFSTLLNERHLAITRHFWHYDVKNVWRPRGIFKTLKWKMINGHQAFLTLWTKNSLATASHSQHYIMLCMYKCCVHKHVWLGWSWTLTRGDAIIVWFCKGIGCHQHTKKCVSGWPQNCFFFIASQELQIPLDE